MQARNGGEMAIRISLIVTPTWPKVLEVKEAIIIDKYECELENGQVVYYAVKGKTTYRMPEDYKAMYDDQHLAIRERYMVRPELFDTTEKHYIPLRTDCDA